MTQQAELLSIQSGTEKLNTNNNQSSQLVDKERVENTGFDIVGNQDHGYFVALGAFRITKAQSKEECNRMINEKDYELIIGLIGACMQANNALNPHEFSEEMQIKKVKDAKHAQIK